MATPVPATRRRFLQIAGTSAAAGGALALTACGDDDDGTASTTSTQKSSAMMGGDVAILNYALTLEYLESQFYADVIGAGVLKGKELDLAKQFGETEDAHVDTLKGTIEKLGGKPVAQPKAKFPLESRDAVLKLAATVENLGAAAYLGKAGEIESEEVLAAALAIHAVEARHAATLNQVLGMTVTPDGAFAQPASEAEVLEAVKPFLTTS
ncbi:MAG: ferritin-like domain-containing protein [Solirubrobacteraceae bacterium]|nr:ferritin-like domain-containing protein [Solirubrobacteraceae bacterium]